MNKTILVLMLGFSIILYAGSTQNDISDVNQWRVFPTNLQTPSYKMFISSHLQITQNDTVLIKADQSQMVEFDLHTGERRMVIMVDEGLKIATFNFLPYYEHYVINVRSDEKDGWFTQIYDSEGQYLGNAVDASNPNKPLFVKQVLVFEDRIFLNDIGGPSDKKPAELQEVRYEPLGDKFEFVKVGKPFGQSFGPEYFEQEFRRKWILCSLGSEHITIANELENRIYEHHALDKTKDRTLPLTYFRSTRNQLSSGKALEEERVDFYHQWLSSLSRITGMFQAGSNVILGYTSPNPKNEIHKDWDINMSEAKGFDQSDLSILWIQKFSLNSFEPLGKPKPFPECILIGIFGDNELALFSTKTKDIITLTSDQY